VDRQRANRLIDPRDKSSYCGPKRWAVTLLPSPEQIDVLVSGEF